MQIILDSNVSFVDNAAFFQSCKITLSIQMLKKAYRRALATFLGLIDWLFRPEPIERSEEEMKKLAKLTSSLALYDYKGCLASRLPRREITRLNIDIETRDISKCSIHQDKLLAEFGKLKAPCLRIEEKGQISWVDEPEEIVQYLHKNFEITSEEAHLKSA